MSEIKLTKKGLPDKRYLKQQQKVEEARLLKEAKLKELKKAASKIEDDDSDEEEVYEVNKIDKHKKHNDLLEKLEQQNSEINELKDLILSIEMQKDKRRTKKKIAQKYKSVKQEKVEEPLSKEDPKPFRLVL